MSKVHGVVGVMLSLVCYSASAQQNMSLLNSTSVEYAPVVSNDGQYLVFQSNRNAGFKLYESKKQDSIWSEPQSIDPINRYANTDLSIIGSPYFSEDGTTLFFAAVFGDTYGDLDLYYSVRKNNNWSKPEHLSDQINSKLPETSPSLNVTGDTLFFLRKGTDPSAPTCGKVFFSIKTNDKWSAAQPFVATQASCYTRLQQTYAMGYYWADADNKQQLLQSVNGTVKKQDVLSNYISTIRSNSKTSWITPKEEELIYVSNGDIYDAPLAYNTHIKGTSFIGQVKDSEKGHAIVPSQMILSDSAHSESHLFAMPTDGEYKLYVPAGYKYQLKVIADKYDTLVKYFVVNKDEWFRMKNEDVLLMKRKRKMVFNVSDKDNGKNLKVKVKVTNKNTGEEIFLDENNQQDGRYTVHLREGDEYSVEVNNVEGYTFVKKDLSADATDDFSIPVSKIKTGTSLEIEDIFFDFNSYKLSVNSYAELDKLVQWMKTNKKVMVQIEAHTDDIGSDEFNNNLSDKRAKEIVLYLTKKGIQSSRMKAKGFGKEKPRAEGDTEEARAQNRRVELHILNIQQ